jgi:hypothetical protein
LRDAGSLAQNGPITPEILTHWQSLFGNGNMAGLWGLDVLLERVQAVFGEQVEWARCSELAQMAVKRQKASR